MGFIGRNTDLQMGLLRYENWFVRVFNQLLRSRVPAVTESCVSEDDSVTQQLRFFFHVTSTPYKPDTSLEQPLRLGPEGVRRRERVNCVVSVT